MRFPHSLVLLKAGDYQRDGGGHVMTDDAGFPLELDATPTPFQGWLQPAPTPKRIRDVQTTASMAASESGEAFSSHLLFAPMGLRFDKSDRVRKDPPNGLWYEVAIDGQDAAGRGHHQEVDLIEYRLPGDM